MATLSPPLRRLLCSRTWHLAPLAGWPRWLPATRLTPSRPSCRSKLRRTCVRCPHGTPAGVSHMCFIHVWVLRVGCQAKYTGMIQCFRKVMAEEGFTGLYRGALSPIAGAMAHNANVFFSYSLAKKVVGSIHHRDHTDLTIAQLFAAGSMAGAVISVVETPVDLFKIKLQRQGLHVRAWHGC